MHKYKITAVAALAICLVLIMIGLSSAAYGANYPLIVGQRHASRLLKAGAPAGLPAAARRRAVDVSPIVSTSGGLVEGDTLTLDLFPDAVYAARVDRVSSNVNGTVTVRGRIENNPMAYTLISTTGKRSLVEIDIPERNQHFIIQSDASGNHYLADVSAVVPDKLEDGPSPVPPVEGVSSNGIEERVSASGPLDPATVDVMIVYTPAARAWADGSGGGIANVIAQAMAKGQLTCDNSNTLLTMRLAYSTETAYTESGTSSTDLNRLTNTSDGYMDEVHTLRNQYGADIVTLLAQVSDTGGLGWLLSTTGGSPSYAFNLCRVQQSGWTYTVVHEQGHNMGCHHAKSQTTQPGPGLFSYSAGWRWVGNDGGKYCSVMTYESGSYFADGQTHTAVAYWSNPSITYQGMATGEAADADNARSIREIKHVIAAYRASTPPSIGTHPVSQVKCVGQSVTFSVVASGTAPLSYQWRKGGSNVGTNSPSYTIPSVQTTHAGTYDCVVSNSRGTVTSNSATLTVNTPPSINTHPISQAKCAGESVTFTVVASGTAPLSYQWRKGGSNVGTNSPSYTIPSVQTTHAGIYDCVVTNGCSSVTSNAATLTVSTGPTITNQPANAVTWVGGPATFSVTATGVGTLSYQWRKGGSSITGATGSSYTISIAALSDNGSYDYVMTDDCGSVTSAAATLTVIAPTAAIASVKLIPDGQPVALAGKPITYASTDFFYVEETNRSSGIRVERADHGLSAGSCAYLAGMLSTNVDGERFIAASSAIGDGIGSAAAVAMGNRALCGSDWQYNSAAHTGQRGGTSLVGLNNVGLLIATWGGFTKTSNTTFTLNDGFGYPITCLVEPGVSLSSQWQYANVIGVSSIFKVNSIVWWPRVLVREIHAY